MYPQCKVQKIKQWLRLLMVTIVNLAKLPPHPKNMCLD